MASVSFNRAMTDAVAVLRLVWLEAGGAAVLVAAIYGVTTFRFTALEPPAWLLGLIFRNYAILSCFH